ncbi:MAG: two-component system, OmpR family, phosphate regulon sensor histidine kinase PhoR [Thermodesulfobacteriota bacterium]|nr:two-component system, OmpR family, phosphate regulon sensor histidine kinase PhoR [Thermodesulfobacteriota bacterium]
MGGRLFRQKKLLWQLLVSYVVVIILSVSAISWYAVEALKTHAIEEVTRELKTQATLVSELVRDNLLDGKEHSISDCCRSFASSLNSRITVTTADGRVIADSQQDPARMDDHSRRPEIRQALTGSVGTSQRYSETLNAVLVYVAVPVERDNRVIGVVRASKPVDAVTLALTHAHLGLALAAMIIAVLAALPSLYFARRIGKVFLTLKDAATKFVQDDLDHRLDIPPWDEVAGLAVAMNRMAEQMSERISLLNSRRQELEAVLTSMVEGVLIVDNEERLLSINNAAARLFKCKTEGYHRRNFMEVIRNTDLQNFVKKALSSESTVEDDIVILGQTDVFLQAHGTLLSDVQGKRMGTLIVLNDVTRLKNLERMRSDLVTNASHELKTPVTAIKGFLETLRDGALDEPETARRFLDIMIRQSNRLASIIEDMLSLSRIEKAAENASVELERKEIAWVLAVAHKEFLTMAQEKGVELVLSCQDGIEAMIQENMFQQAILNLVDNAIKYTEPGGTVTISSNRENGKILVCVEDDGLGIPREHLTRIFERFYRVDAGRSRKMGGTGLGLAIVKHIVTAHGGEVHVASSPGSGSKFCIELPPPSGIRGS